MQATSIALACTSTWYLAWKHGWHFSSADELNLTGAIVSTLGVAFGITAALVLGSVWEKYNKVVIAVFQKDRETFLFYRDERMPIMIHLLLAAISFPLLGVVGMLDYRQALSGAASVFSVSLALSFYWIVAVELQNPAKSVWFAERIPKEWLAINIDAHFGLGEDRQTVPPPLTMPPTAAAVTSRNVLAGQSVTQQAGLSL